MEGEEISAELDEMEKAKGTIEESSDNVQEEGMGGHAK